MLRKRLHSFLPVLLLLGFNIVSHFLCCSAIPLAQADWRYSSNKCRTLLSKDGLYIYRRVIKVLHFWLLFLLQFHLWKLYFRFWYSFSPIWYFGYLIWAKTRSVTQQKYWVQKLQLNTNGDIFLFGRSDWYHLFDNLVLPATHVVKTEDKQFLLKIKFKRTSSFGVKKILV